MVLLGSDCPLRGRMCTEGFSTQSSQNSLCSERNQKRLPGSGGLTACKPTAGEGREPPLGTVPLGSTAGALPPQALSGRAPLFLRPTAWQVAALAHARPVLGMESLPHSHHGDTSARGRPAGRGSPSWPQSVPGASGQSCLCQEWGAGEPRGWQWVCFPRAESADCSQGHLQALRPRVCPLLCTAALPVVPLPLPLSFGARCA